MRASVLELWIDKRVIFSDHRTDGFEPRRREEILTIDGAVVPAAHVTADIIVSGFHCFSRDILTTCLK